jgi:Myb/SANT-like DNA-binding domain
MPTTVMATNSQRGGRERGGRGGQGSRAPAFNWGAGNVFVDFLQALADQVTAGRRAESSFKKQTFVDIHALLTSKGYNIPLPSTLKAKYHATKQLYREWVSLLNASGFGRDKETGAVTASDECWDAYIAVSDLSILVTRVSRCMIDLSIYRNTQLLLVGVIDQLSTKNCRESSSPMYLQREAMPGLLETRKMWEKKMDPQCWMSYYQLMPIQKTKATIIRTINQPLYKVDRLYLLCPHQIRRL